MINLLRKACKAARQGHTATCSAQAKRHAGYPHIHPNGTVDPADEPWGDKKPERRIRLKPVAAFFVALSLLTPAHAVEPDEILADPKLEQRARELSKGLRCLVCRNQSIDDSDAGLAKDLRVAVRDRLVAGDTDDEVLDFVVDRYGEYVLLKPRFTLENAALYLGGPLLLILGGFAFWRMTRKPTEVVAASPAPQPLSEEEKRRLDALLKKDG